MSKPVDLEAIENGEQPTMDTDEAVVLDTTRGPDDTLSSRVPRQITVALDIAQKDSSVNKSDLIRKALFEFLSENNKGALVEAKKKIEQELKRAKKT